jgi:hypothetical protein
MPGEPAGDQSLHRDVRVLLAPPGQPLGEQLLRLQGSGLPVDEVGERRIVELVEPRVHGDEGRAPSRRHVEGEGDRRFAQRGAVDPHDHGQ